MTQEMAHDERLESLLTFPTDFPIKVMGKDTPAFRDFVSQTVDRLIPKERLLRVEEKLSSNGQYVSLTVMANFLCREDIDAVYQTLTANPLVLMAL